MRQRLQWDVLAAALAAGLLFASGCTSGGGRGRPCDDASPCEAGQVCGEAGTCESVPCISRAQCQGASTCLASGVCGPEECANNGECGEGQICKERACFPASVLPACEDGGACASGKVCNPQSSRCEDCSATLRCPTGQTCRNGSCEAGQTPCNNDQTCLPSGRVCDQQAMACVACSSSRPCPASHTCEAGSCKPRPTCQNGQCQPPLTCDTASGFCISAGTVALCGSCNTDAECQGTGSKCLVFTDGSKYCGQACSTQRPCPEGYLCHPSQQQCAPAAGRCRDNCTLAACTSGTCDPLTGLCMGPKRLCDSCSSDAECGAPTDRCVAGEVDGGTRYCSQDCDTSAGHVGGRACPTGFTCRELSGGVKQCLPVGAQCVVDPCATVHCSAPTRFCNPATRACVECLESQQCPASDQICQNNQCVIPGACTGDPSCASDPAGSRCCSTALGMRCAQCCSNSHCGGTTPYCVANRCQSQQDPCAGVVCTPPQTCNPANGNCEGGGGGTSCTRDQDCPPASSGGQMACDQQYHFCYDPSGLCSSDAECVPGQTCLLFCTGCSNTGGVCPGGLFSGLICLFDFCIPFM